MRMCKFTLWWKTHSLRAAVAAVQMECPSEALGSIKRRGDGGKDGKMKRGMGVDGEGK